MGEKKERGRAKTYPQLIVVIQHLLTADDVVMFEANQERDLKVSQRIAMNRLRGATSASTLSLFEEL